jgi:hypothetical protein
MHTFKRVFRPGRRAGMRAFLFDSKQMFHKPDSAKLKDQNALNEAESFLETVSVPETETSVPGST